MQFENYLEALKDELLKDASVVDVTVQLIHYDTLARVRAFCAPGCGAHSVTHFVAREDVEGYESVSDGNDIARLLRGCNRTSEEQAKTEAALRELDRLRDRGRGWTQWRVANE